MQNYIIHPSNMRNQDFLLEMRVEEGARGYGIYIMILELMRDAERYRIKNNPKLIAFAINEQDTDCVERIIKNYGLFQLEDDGYLSSSWLTSTLVELEKKTQALREAGKRGARAKNEKSKNKEQQDTDNTDNTQSISTHPISHPSATLKPPLSINNINNINKLINKPSREVIVCDGGEVLSVEVLDSMCRNHNAPLQEHYHIKNIPDDGVERNTLIAARLANDYNLMPWESAFLNAVTDFCRVGGKNLTMILKMDRTMKSNEFKPNFWASYILKKMMEA